ncbi:MAG: dual specificity protein phosphatase family protein, partial [Blastocatellia bacterium]|nr:dual specificity protein phosphatase family protein [Blastocatellia bacterium]
EKRNAPVFVHCRRGSDRTGVIIALYRIKQDGWTAEQAIKEANLYGMGFIQFRKRQYINDYYKSLQTAGIDGRQKTEDRRQKTEDPQWNDFLTSDF